MYNKKLKTCCFGQEYTGQAPVQMRHDCLAAAAAEVRRRQSSSNCPQCLPKRQSIRRHEEGCGGQWSSPPPPPPALPPPTASPSSTPWSSAGSPGPSSSRGPLGMAGPCNPVPQAHRSPKASFNFQLKICTMMGKESSQQKDRQYLCWHTLPCLVPMWCTRRDFFWTVYPHTCQQIFNLKGTLSKNLEVDIW